MQLSLVQYALCWILKKSGLNVVEISPAFHYTILIQSVICKSCFRFLKIFVSCKFMLFISRNFKPDLLDNEIFAIYPESSVYNFILASRFAFRNVLGFNFHEIIFIRSCRKSYLVVSFAFTVYAIVFDARLLWSTSKSLKQFRVWPFRKERVG